MNCKYAWDDKLVSFIRMTTVQIVLYLLAWGHEAGQEYKIK